eukprot:CAMPEP_0168824452 /NCGR_PEP_ID=MMETSP0726-20121227/11100_1 /TAXON_ID=265536 /ORGANISM="Amphiprora sp., Strain CCMP467" /LENGTH=525 /DNA_ID=CAMNT_0008877451 /DNA_START=5 /DNA_END=1580 /DNA_ORIENTATION=-
MIPIKRELSPPARVPCSNKTSLDNNRSIVGHYRHLIIALTTMYCMTSLRQAVGFSPMRQVFARRMIQSVASQASNSAAREGRLQVATDPSVEKNDFDEFVEKQADVSSRLGSNISSSSTMIDRSEFVKHQAIPVYDTLANRIIDNLLGERRAAFEDESNEEEKDCRMEPFRILDVACGTGALWPFLMRQADQRNMTLHIQGVDLSSNMVDYGKQHSLLLFNNEFNDSRHEIQTDCTDVMDYHAPTQKEAVDGDDSATIEKALLYDAVICNACWANFYSPQDVLQHITNNLLVSHMSSKGNAFGQLFITHPLGAGAVQDLHDADPITVPHTLPLQWDHSDLIGLPVETKEFVQEVDVASFESETASAPFYFTNLKRVRHSLLPEVWRFRGPVAHGYGRGGKKLGFPTANLVASEFFQTALNDLETGVYVGWAFVEEAGDVVHKAVVNVGYSPTFEGKENPEKMIEAHLMPNILDDFYGKTMRLELLAYLRPEQKFASFPDLIAQINADATDAKWLLESHPILSKAH